MSAEFVRRPEILLPKNKLLLIDLDKTLIDKNYKINDDRINSEISRLQVGGWQIGLSSDTPLITLQKWSDVFGMNGPIIAERGALVNLGKRKQIEVVSGSEDYFSGLKRSLVEILAKEKISFLYGDAISLLTERPKFSEYVLINNYRQCSLGFWGRSIDKDGEISLNNRVVANLLSKLKQKLDESPFELVLDFNKEYGIFIASPKFVNKREGTKRLMKEMGLREIGVIGDSTTDIIGKDIAVHYCVGNSEAELANVSDYVSDKSFTTGVVDILQRIIV